MCPRYEGLIQAKLMSNLFWYSGNQWLGSLYPAVYETPRVLLLFNGLDS